MTIKDYFGIIQTTGNFRGSIDQIGANICTAMGMIGIDPYTVKKWIYPPDDKNRTPNVKKYFSEDGKIKINDIIVNTDGFIEYFKDYFKAKPTYERPSLEEWEQAFCRVDNKGVIDTEHGEQEFYWSLLYQLCLMFELPKPKKPLSMVHTLPKSNAPVLFGRQQEIEEITKKLEENNYLILTGISGYGKSHLAFAYAYKLREVNGYDVQLIRCDNFGSLREVISRLQFDGLADSTEDVKEKFDMRVNALHTIKQSVLIILDNFNQKFTPVDRADMQKLPDRDNVKILITSRRELVGYKDKLFRVGSLDENARLELYSYHRFGKSSNVDSNKTYTDERKEILNEMFERYENHTLMIELLAKLPKKIGLDEAQINKYLQHTLNISSRTMGATISNEPIEDTVKNIISQLFFKPPHSDTETDIMESELIDTEKDIMRSMSLVSPDGMNRRLFEELIDYGDEKYDGDEIDNLLESNLIMMDDEERVKIRLHPLVFEIVYEMEENEQFYANFLIISNDEHEIDEEYIENMDETKQNEFSVYIQSENFYARLCNRIAELEAKVNNSKPEDADDLRDLRKTMVHIRSKVIFDVIANSQEFSELDPATQLGYYQINKMSKIHIENTLGLEDKNRDIAEVWKQYPPSPVLPTLLKQLFPEQYDDKDFNGIFPPQSDSGDIVDGAISTSGVSQTDDDENIDYSEIISTMSSELKQELFEFQSILTENGGNIDILDIPISRELFDLLNTLGIFESVQNTDDNM